MIRIFGKEVIYNFFDFGIKKLYEINVFKVVFFILFSFIVFLEDFLSRGRNGKRENREIDFCLMWLIFFFWGGVLEVGSIWFVIVERRLFFRLFCLFLSRLVYRFLLVIFLRNLG